MNLLSAVRHFARVASSARGQQACMKKADLESHEADNDAQAEEDEGLDEPNESPDS